MDPLIVTQAINLLYAISTLAVLALGLAVIFGLLGVLNIAHGEFIMIGAYCAYVTQASGWPYLAAVPLTLVVAPRDLRRDLPWRRQSLHCGQLFLLYVAKCDCAATSVCRSMMLPLLWD
jgi:branched-subunit amino acid ABC-type transport system permease component